MPHTAMTELGELARALNTASMVVNKLQTEMAVDPALRKTLSDSVLTVETNNQGALTLVLDFAPGSPRDSAGMDRLKAFLTQDQFYFDMKEHRAGGKYHSVYEMKIKHRGISLKNENFFVRVTHAGGTSSKVDQIEDSVLGGNDA